MEQTPAKWSPSSWKEKRALQQPVYPDQRALERVLKRLSNLPPLVTSWEIETLKKELAEASEGKRFVLHGGDCSEDFQECESNSIANKLKVLLEMSLVLVYGANKPLTRIGRFAGQYAKPRSSDTETIDGVTLPSYRGDMINRSEFTKEARTPDPELMLRAYERSALTLNFVRSLAVGGFADLHHPEYWDLGFAEKSPNAEKYHQIVNGVKDSLRFMHTLSGRAIPELETVVFYSSHEGLHLLYEQAQTRRVPRWPGWYNLSTHFPWIGDRTRDIEGAHVEYFRGIRNPIGVKIGPGATPEELMELTGVLNPDNQPGRLTLIHRFGKDKIEACLPGLVEIVKRRKKSVLWCCDPMHGNTEITQKGVKTRSFDNIRSELDKAFQIHKECGSVLGGVHVELTGEDVTECTGGAKGLTESELSRDYRSQVDPRLNFEQAFELALLTARRMQDRSG